MKRMTLGYNGKTVLSDSFNFKTYRAISDALGQGLAEDAIDIASRAGLIALFDGTEITAEALTSEWWRFDEAELSAALSKVMAWYSGVRLRKDRQTAARPPEDAILGLYKGLLKTYNMQPSEVDKQDPQLLIDILSMDDIEAAQADSATDAAKAFYGL